MEVLTKTVLLCFQRALLPVRWTHTETSENKVVEGWIWFAASECTSLLLAKRCLDQFKGIIKNTWRETETNKGI